MIAVYGSLYGAPDGQFIFFFGDVNKKRLEVEAEGICGRQKSTLGDDAAAVRLLTHKSSGPQIVE